MPPYVIVICHQKGGVGKTTTALALGACFAEKGLRSLAVDLDPQANLTFNLGLDPAKTPCSIADVLAGAVDPARAVMPSNLPGLDLISSGDSMLGISRRLFEIPDYEFSLRRALQDPALGEYALALVDTPPSVGPLTLNALTAGDLLIIPTQCEYYSIQALRDMFELVNVVRDRTNPPLTYRLLVTMFDARGKFHAGLRDQLQNLFGEGLLRTTIGFDTKLREAQAAGLPITVHAPHSRGAAQYRALAEELLPYVSQKPQVRAD
jgi:chromosome partitioning protein